MTTAGFLLLIAGLLVAGGIVTVTVAAALRGSDAAPDTPSSSDRLVRVRVTRLQLGGVAAGILALLVTGWPVAALGVGAAVIFVPKVLGGAATAKQATAKSQALADWTRRLADLIASGAAGSTTEALRRSLTSVPEPIAGPVAALVARMRPQGAEAALRQFATDVADPSGDKIAMVLILRERNGGPGLAEVLTGLAEDLDERSRMVREVEAERAKPRANARTIVTVTLALVTLMMLFAHQFLSAYSSALGQVMLAVVVALFAVSLRWMRTLSDPAPGPRILTDPTVGVSR